MSKIDQIRQICQKNYSSHESSEMINSWKELIELIKEYKCSTLEQIGSYKGQIFYTYKGFFIENEDKRFSGGYWRATNGYNCFENYKNKDELLEAINKFCKKRKWFVFYWKCLNPNLSPNQWIPENEIVELHPLRWEEKINEDYLKGINSDIHIVVANFIEIN